MIRLLATDMDGTFLDKSGKYDTQRLKNLLEECKHKDVFFVVASGRCLLSIKELFAEFQNDIIFIAENGGVVEYRGKVLYEEIMPREIYLKIVKEIQDSHFQNTNTVHLSGKQATYVFSDISPAYQEFLEHYSPRLLPVDDFTTVADAIYKVGASFSYDELHDASSWITQSIPGVVSMTSGYDCLDVMMEQVNKGYALKKLCAILGVDTKDVMAFGDNLNDKDMLTVAGHAIVPENARPEIKELADKMIASHETGSVISYMEETLCRLN